MTSRTRKSSAKSSERKKKPAVHKAKPAVKSKPAVKAKAKQEKTAEIKLERTNKTPQVMRLIEQNNSANPVILAGKSRIPRQLSGREPLSRMLKRELGEEFHDVEGTVVVNLTQLAIEYAAPEILDRFNACSCDKCVEEFSRIIIPRVPMRFARIKKASQHRGSRELTERIEPVRRIVLSEMIKELIGNKKRCFHDEEEQETEQNSENE